MCREVRLRDVDKSLLFFFGKKTFEVLRSVPADPRQARSRGQLSYDRYIYDVPRELHARLLPRLGDTVQHLRELVESLIMRRQL